MLIPLLKFYFNTCVILKRSGNNAPSYLQSDSLIPTKDSLEVTVVDNLLNTYSDTRKTSFFKNMWDHRGSTWSFMETSCLVGLLAGISMCTISYNCIE